jgi:hypothetical protein
LVRNRVCLRNIWINTVRTGDSDDMIIIIGRKEEEKEKRR